MLTDRKTYRLTAMLAPLPRWPVDSKRSRVLAGILLALFAAYGLTFLAVTAGRMTDRRSGDFFGSFWSSARFIHDHPAAEVYDSARLHAAQVALGMAASSDYPFPYPPPLLLVLWPLGLLPYFPAYVIATGGSLILFVWATIGKNLRLPMTLAAVLTPTTTITIVAGQAGLLAAGLLIGGFRLADRRPIVAGILFGLLTYKPQIGVLVPVALVAAGMWRTIAAAAVTVVILALLACAAFGLAVWPAWAMAIQWFSGHFAVASGGVRHLMPTVTASLSELGAAPAIAQAGQLAAAAAAALIVWRCFRRGSVRLASAALFVATFLATPHAFVYDMPPITAAVLWLVAECREAGDGFATSEVLIMAAAMVSPIMLVALPAGSPAVAVILVLLLAIIVRRLRLAPGQSPADPQVFVRRSAR